MTRDSEKLEKVVAAVLASAVVFGLVAAVAVGVTLEQKSEPISDESAVTTDHQRSSTTDTRHSGEGKIDEKNVEARFLNSSEDTEEDEPSSMDIPGTDPGEPWFEEVSRERGLVVEGGGGFGSGILEGSPTGVYVADVERDGWPDVLVTTTIETVLFDNQEGEFRQQMNLSQHGDFTAALFFDHDNSGYDDLFLMGDESSLFLENQGGELIPKDVGLPEEFASVRGATAADFDGDGCLDVFVVQANDWRETRPAGYDDRSISIAEDNGKPNLLYMGDCGGFQNTTQTAGVRGSAWSLTTSAVDLTRDGLPDIHVANDFNRDVVYVNRGDGTFRREILPEFTNRNGMSSEVADVNGDGHPEVFVTNVHGDAMIPSHRYGGRIQGNYLLRYDPESGFRNVAPELGLVEGGFGWAAIIDDLNNDGYLDVLHSATDRTGYEYPALWKGRPDSMAFQRLNSSAAGLRASGFLGAADLDFDRDGQLDVLLADARDRYDLYRNLNDGRYLQVYVEPGNGHTAIGSTVTVHDGGDVTTKHLTANTDYMSQGWRTLHFGLGDTRTVDRVVITRPDGRTQVLEDVDAGQRIAVGPQG